MMPTFHRRGLRALALSALLLPAAAPVARATQVTFRHQPVIGGVQSVSVAGTFNSWSTAATPLRDDDGDGVWETALDLAPGRYEYKFVVNGDRWFTDESAAAFVPDPYGGRNSVLVVKDEPVTVGAGSTVAKPKAPAPGLRKVTFRYRPGAPPASLSLAGTFNGWTPGRTMMTDPAGDGEYTVTLLLAAGAYQYKFVADGRWIQDLERQDGQTDDGHGGNNSIVEVDERFPAVVVKAGDGDVFTEGVVHVQSPSEVNNRGGGRVQLTARAHHGDVEGVDVVLLGAKPKAVPMQVVGRDQVYDYFRAEVRLPAGETPYVFRYRDGGKPLYLTSGGFSASADGSRFTYNEARFPAFVTPDWVKDAVIYQIFPDRFRNGRTANDPDFKEWYYRGKNELPPDGRITEDWQEFYHLVHDWNDVAGLTRSPYRADGKPDWMAFYGGDIEGVRQGLDYLADLGVTAIYFNPLFEAKSVHKYDGADYMKLDPHFGTNEEFIAFVKAARRKGIRVILDIVYNHSGNGHWAFKDAVEKGPASPYYTWYEFKQWPLPEGWPDVRRPWKASDYYYCWWGFGDLPDLNFDLARDNEAEKAVRDSSQAQVNWPLVGHLLDATAYWLKTAGVDGVRLDVPNEVPRWFWKLFNERVKKAKPDAYVVAELWGDARDDVGPGRFDAVMNYAFFRDPVARFLGQGQGSAAEFDGALAAGRMAYPAQAVEAQMNLIDSHDTPRFLTQVGGNVERLKLAAMFALTYVGAPHIYYGDEIGMEGGRDPDCRRPFPWSWAEDPERVALRDYYKRLIALRRAHAALRTGDFRAVHAAGMLYAYTRSGGGEEFLVALNAGQQAAELPLDLSAWAGTVRATDLLTGASERWSAVASIPLPGETGRVFKLGRPGASAAAK